MEKLAVKMIEHSGLGKTELAERLGVDRTSLWGWESGRRRMGAESFIKLIQIIKEKGNASSVDIINWIINTET